MSDSLTSTQRPRPPRLAWVAVALPPLLLTLGTLTGVALLRGAPTSLAIAGGIALTGLPVLGVAAALGGHARAFALAAWCWSLLALASLPLYFPGERSDATRFGLAALTAPLGEARSGDLAGLGVAVVERLGPDPAPLPLATPIEESVTSPSSGDTALIRLDGDREVPRDHPPRTTRIPYAGDGRSMRIEATIDGPDFGEELSLIFDTGATFTTLNREALRMIGLPVPRDAPWVTLRTANGTVEAPLVLVDAVWLGDEVVEWVTIAVCEPCATGDTAGLLGLNVSSQFGVSIDHDRKSIELRPRRGRPNRRLDIEQWVQMESTATRWGDGRIEVAIQAENRSERSVRAAIFEVECVEQSFAVQLSEIPSHSTQATTVSLPRDIDCSRYGVKLRNASWLLDRF